MIDILQLSLISTIEHSHDAAFEVVLRLWFLGFAIVATLYQILKFLCFVEELVKKLIRFFCCLNQFSGVVLCDIYNHVFAVPQKSFVNVSQVLSSVTVA